MLVWRSETHGGQTGRLVQLEGQMALDLHRRFATAGNWFDIGSLIAAALVFALCAASAAS